ncbi:MAG: SAM-dependent chlorinase/fluorinase [Solobacterium sp.]|jgi:S-adenosylmethionine hydrolase|nr:SAM-dependent chlorinase/fluorinase [Solobacterium sp.]MCH4221914.1 SAM-dependent chlorinase/fluorinase [Solobacterium sp.]MCH4265228.1 SAM-dependent chlorinase/fluorinase [Solobacterium sp.]
MKPIIVLQTDFSLTWGAVSSMKGVIAIVDPELRTEDLCHDIRSYDTWEASLSLNTVEPYWPKGTIFVSVVDPGVGTSRRASVALLKDGSYVVTPDNGTLTHLYHSVGIQAVREIDETRNRYHGTEDVSVFHGRDLFGYCAALLASGKITFEEVGPEYPLEDIVQCEEYQLKPVLKNKEASGFIMTGLKHFGGIQMNITNEEWKKCGFQEGDYVHTAIAYQNKVIFERDVKYARSFGYVKKGEPVLYCGSSLYLCLDCNQENFMEKYGVDTGRDWKISFTEPKQSK